MAEHTYLAIDLKSFYASVECVARGLDPMDTNLVVADAARTEKTICLAVSPALKTYGIPGRPRLFEVAQKVRAINQERLRHAPGHVFAGESSNGPELKKCPSLSLSYITAPPRMSCYMDCSASIYRIYLKYVAPEDIHVYSIDEVFMDVTHYLDTYRLTARELAERILGDVLQSTGITATAGIGPNLYLSKVAMDIVAKHIAPDENGACIAELDEPSYRRLLWKHRPLSDFWRVGKGYEKKLEERGLFTMGDIARCSVGGPEDYYNEELLYQLFGVNAELLIDHAWGWEPCTIADIKAYRPESSSLSAGQVLTCPYPYEKARLIVREMADRLALDLVEKGLVTNQLVLTVGYDAENLMGQEEQDSYQGEVTTDRYGRKIPRHAHGTANLGRQTASSRLMTKAAAELYDRIVDKKLSIRRITIATGRVVDERVAAQADSYEQLDLFTDYASVQQKQEEEKAALEREKRMQETVLDIQRKFGRNAVLKGMNLEEGATAIKRNGQIGGHKA